MSNIDKGKWYQPEGPARYGQWGWEPIPSKPVAQKKAFTLEDTGIWTAIFVFVIWFFNNCI